MIGAAVNWAGAIAMFINKDFKYDMLIMAAAVLIGYIIPGLLYIMDAIQKILNNGLGKLIPVFTMEFKELDPILHSQLRLAVVSLLISVREAEFTFLKEKTNSTAGNLSVQINKLKDAGYIEVTKQFSNNYPQTICKITKKGIESFEAYVNALQSYMNPGIE